MTSPPTGQKDVQELAGHPASLAPNVAFRSPSLDTISEFWSSEHDSCLVPRNLHCTCLHHSLVLLDWLCCLVSSPGAPQKAPYFFPPSLLLIDRLCCVSGEWTRVWFHNTFYAQSTWLWMN